MRLALVVIATCHLVAACGAQRPQPPPELEGSVASRCPVEAGFAIAVTSPEGTGRYVVVEPGGRISELGLFTDAADLSCLTPAGARDLDRSIRENETMHGGISPVGDATVVCGFTDATTAVCWQYSSDAGRFVKVGGWTT